MTLHSECTLKPLVSIPALSNTIWLWWMISSILACVVQPQPRTVSSVPYFQFRSCARMPTVSVVDKARHTLGLPCLLCFARPDCWNTTPLECICGNTTRSADMKPTCPNGRNPCSMVSCRRLLGFFSSYLKKKRKKTHT